MPYFGEHSLRLANPGSKSCCNLDDPSCSQILKDIVGPILQEVIDWVYKTEDSLQEYDMWTNTFVNFEAIPPQRSAIAFFQGNQKRCLDRLRQ